MNFEAVTKLAIYRWFADTGRRPSVEEIARVTASDPADVRLAFARLCNARVLVLDEGGAIRMAPPFSGVPTQHQVEAGGLVYFANCAWDAFGIPVALRRFGTIRSLCEQSREPLELDVRPDRPPSSDWLFHCAVPAVRWWDDIVFT